MTDVLLFHHALGVTQGVVAFADGLRAAGHQVTVPGLYDGATYATIEAGVAHAERVGFDTIVAAGLSAAESLPAELVYAGFSLGALPAQELVRTRAGARGALLYHGSDAIPASGADWPAGVALQLHQTQGDEWSPLADARKVASTVHGAELFVYAGSAHLFTDASLDGYDEEATRLVLERSLALLHRVTG